MMFHNIELIPKLKIAYLNIIFWTLNRASGPDMLLKFLMMWE